MFLNNENTSYTDEILLIFYLQFIFNRISIITFTLQSNADMNYKVHKSLSYTYHINWFSSYK